MNSRSEAGGKRQGPTGQSSGTGRIVVRALALAGGGLLLAAIWYPLRYSLPGPLGSTEMPAPRETVLVSNVSRGDFVGAQKCAGCHAAEFAKWENSTHGRAAGSASPDSLTHAANCEGCHGPGRRHVQLAESSGLGNRADIGMVSLGTLDKDASLRLCFQCHSVKDQLHEGYLPGKSLEQFYSLRLPALVDRPLTTDGRVRTFALQEGLRYSDCYVNGGLTCTSCHDPHSQGSRSNMGEPLATRTDNAQCTACHASKAVNETAHTRHASNSPGSRCTSCHMPVLKPTEPQASGSVGTAIRYAGSDHTISIPRPTGDARNGVQSACAQCHANRSPQQLDTLVAAMWGSLKPTPIAYRIQWRAAAAENALAGSLAPDVDGTRESASIARGLQLAPLDSVGRPHEAAAFAGIARFLERNGKADERDLDPAEHAWLNARARSADVDIRAIALAAMHYLSGGRQEVQRELARAAAREGRNDFALRSRWALALEKMGDRDAANGDFGSAATAYARALEARPGATRIREKLARAQLTGDRPPLPF